MATTTTVGYAQQLDAADQTTNWGQLTATSDPFQASGTITLGDPIIYDSDTVNLQVKIPTIFADQILATVRKKLTIYAFGKVNMQRNTPQHFRYNQATTGTGNWIDFSKVGSVTSTSYVAKEDLQVKLREFGGGLEIK